MIKRWFSFAMLSALLVAGRVDAQSSGAGDLYRVAAKEVPTASNPNEQKVLDNVFEAPLDDPAQKLADRGVKALELFDSASQMPFDDWGINTDDVTTGGKTIVGAPALADLVVLRARLRVNKQQFTLAMEDCYNLAQLSRRLSVQPSPARQAQQNLLFDKCARAVALLLPQIPADDADSFFRGVDGLRSPIDPADVIEALKQPYLSYYGRLVTDTRFRVMAFGSDGGIAGLFGFNRPAVDVRNLYRDADAADAAFAEATRTFDDMITALKLAPGERRAAVSQIEDRTRDSHPLVRGVVDLANDSIRLSRSQEIELDMLRTARTICAELPQPIDENAARQKALPYTFEPKPGGFVLSWKPAEGSEPLKLQVGPRAARAEATTRPAASQP